MNVDSIIFDLDGTLWDASKQVTESWNKTLKEMGIARVLTEDDFMGVMGMLMIDIIKTLLPELPEQRQLEVLERCCEDENEYLGTVGGVLYPNLISTIEKLSKHYALSIVSNCQAGYIEAFFRAHHLESYFVDFENPGRTGLPKAENIKLVVERNQFKNPIYVGDTLGDCNSAKKAGVPFIYARYGFGEVTEYDGVIDGIEELLELLEN